MYDPEPSYALTGGEIERGYAVLGRRCADVPGVLAIDGPAALDWDALAARLEASGYSGRIERVRLTERPAVEAIPGDPVFARLDAGTLADLAELPRPAAGQGIVLGPGSAAAEHDVLWYADVPKRDQVATSKDEQRLFFVDWPLQERHLRDLA